MNNLLTISQVGIPCSTCKFFTYHPRFSLLSDSCSFYLPGAFIGSFVSDWVGPRRTLAYGVAAQAIVGFLMAGLYPILAHPKNIGGFCVLYGIFLSLGELGPGDNIGLVASKTCATPFRGKYYAFAAAFGKIGAFIGNYLYPILVSDAHQDTVKGNQYPFW
jgi:MFS family permease